MRRSLLISLGVLAIIVFLAMAFSWVRFHNAVKKYPLGMTLEDAKAKMPANSRILKSGVVFSAGGPSETEKALYALYDVIIEDEGIYLEFNHYERLIGVRSLGNPVLRALERLFTRKSSKVSLRHGREYADVSAFRSELRGLLS